MANRLSRQRTLQLTRQKTHRGVRAGGFGHICETYSFKHKPEDVRLSRRCPSVTGAVQQGQVEEFFGIKRLELGISVAPRMSRRQLDLTNLQLTLMGGVFN